MNYIMQLKHILQASGWSQVQLASKLGVSFVTINAWINGHTIPRKKSRLAIELLFVDIVGTDITDIQELNTVKNNANNIHCSVNKILADHDVLDRLILYMTYNSNVIEGSTMTLADTKAVLFDHKTLPNRTLLEQLEATNHQSALTWLLNQMQKNNFKIDEELILTLHMRLMNGLIENAGQYRNHNVRILGSRTTVVNYNKLATAIKQIVKNLGQSTNDIVSCLAYSHARFETVHPFSDGNGRVGRLLLLAYALNHKKIPPIVLKDKKQAYYKYLEIAQTKEQYSALELFIAKSMVETEKLLFKK